MIFNYKYFPFILYLSLLNSFLLVNLFNNLIINLYYIRILFSFSLNLEEDSLFIKILLTLFIIVYIIEKNIYTINSFFFIEEILILSLIILLFINIKKKIINNKIRKLIIYLISSIVFNYYSFIFFIEELLYFRIIKLEEYDFNYIMKKYVLKNDEVNYINEEFIIPRYESHIKYLITENEISDKKLSVLIDFNEFFIFFNQIKKKIPLKIYWNKPGKKNIRHVNLIKEYYESTNKFLEIIIIDNTIIRDINFKYINSINDIDDDINLNSLKTNPNFEIFIFFNKNYLFLY